jgi:acyl-CoA reductase-like NAD-dependent aldehyde dehydrogenase
MLFRLLLIRATCSSWFIDIVHQANDSVYGLAAAVFSQNISRALSIATRLQAGTVW